MQLKSNNSTFTINIMKNFIFLIATFFLFQKAYCQAGELDSSFGKNGIVKSNLGSTFDYNSIPKQVLEAPDGSLFTVREQDGQTYVTKRDQNGKIDDNYGTNGLSRAINMREEKSFLQPDGKIVLAGYPSASNRADFLVARLNTDGTLDNGFSTDGRQTTKFAAAAYATAVAMQSDGKIVVAGYTTTIDESGNSNFDFALARYNSDGSLDQSFADSGKLVRVESYTDDVPAAVVIQSDDKIIVAGSSTINAQGDHSSFSNIIRYYKNGTIDNTFSLDAEKFGSLFASPNALVVQSDGKIVVVGQSISTTGGDNETTTTDIFIARYTDTGSLDKTFNQKGWETTNFGYDNETAFAVAIYGSGKIGVGCNIYNGNNTDFAFARYNASGGLDSGFSNNGLQRVDFDYGEEKGSLFAIHEGGRIVMAGSTNYVNLGIAHLNYDGSADTTFNGNGKLTVPFFSNDQGSTHFTCTAVQTDGKIVVGGNTWNGNNTDFLIVRYNVNGKLDSTFNQKGWLQTDLSVFAEGVSSIAIQSDGKIVAGGHTSDQSGIRFALARYNTNGTLDSTFSGDGIQNTNLNWFGQINSIAMQADGKIVAAGNVWNGSNNDVAVARYNSNGSLDSTFSSDGIQQTDLGNSEDIGKSVAIQSDGKIVIAGSVLNYANTDFVIVRYTADGSLDASFNTNGIVIADLGGNDDCEGAALQADGKIVAAGSTYKFEDYDYLNTDMAAARFNANGSPDNTFGTNGVVITDLGNNDKASSVAIETNGKIVLGGGSDSRFAFVRYDIDGSLDSTFSQNGISTVSSKGTNAIENTVEGIAISNSRLYAVGDGKYPGNLGVMVKYQLDEGKIKPIVSITTPANNAVYPIHAIIKIKAIASDPDGSVIKVEFYNGSKLLNTKTSAPYGYSWNNVPAGVYTLTAKATDNSGNITVSDSVKVSVIPHNPPTVSLINPVNNDVFSGPTTIHLGAAAIDPEGTISKVEFYIGDSLIRTERAYPYTYTWINARAGKYSLTAVATNNFGLTTKSAVVHIAVVTNKKPSVIITNLANNQSFAAPATIPMTATAKDPDGTISKVEFYNGTALLATQYWSPYSSTWKDVPAGSYTITAKATDNLGFSATSAPVKITVTAPVVSSRPSSENNKISVPDVLSLKAWPNPAGNTLIISAGGLSQNKPATISVISASGVVMKTIQSAGLNGAVQIDVSSLASGMYTIKVTSENKVINKPFMKL